MRELVRLLKFATFYLEQCSFDANFMNSNYRWILNIKNTVFKNMQAYNPR